MRYKYEIQMYMIFMLGNDRSSLKFFIIMKKLIILEHTARKILAKVTLSLAK